VRNEPEEPWRWSAPLAWPAQSDHTTSAIGNQYWPTSYRVDGKGRIRFHRFAPGECDQCERGIQELLRKNVAQDLDSRTIRISPTGVEAPPSDDVRSPETYAGSRRTERFASRLAHDSPKTYGAPLSLALNQRGLGGVWIAGSERDSLRAATGSVVFRFHLLDLHLAPGPSRNGNPIRLKVTLNGAAPEDDHGLNRGPDGSGEVREPRLYQLIPTGGPAAGRHF
jgi:hypothetical protein